MEKDCKKQHFRKTYDEDEGKKHNKIPSRLPKTRSAKAKSGCSGKGKYARKHKKRVKRQMNGQIQQKYDDRPRKAVYRKKNANASAEGVSAEQEHRKYENERGGMNPPQAHKQQKERCRKAPFQKNKEHVPRRKTDYRHKSVAVAEVKFVNGGRFDKYYATHSTTQKHQKKG